MPEIKVIGDIRSGKYQPTLTGNAIVDAALIEHFCQQLAAALGLAAQKIQPEHHWNLAVAPHVIYIVTDQVWRVGGDHMIPHNVIVVPAIAVQRGDVRQITQQVHTLLTQTSSSL